MRERYLKGGMWHCPIEEIRDIDKAYGYWPDFNARVSIS